MAYSYTLSSHDWYGVYEVTASVRAVKFQPLSLPQWSVHRSMFDKENQMIASNTFAVGGERW